MAIPKTDNNQKYTYADYLNWEDNERWELINGEAYNMTPAPSRRHQKITRELMLQIGGFLRNKDCEIYNAPFDVRLPNPDEEANMTGNVVQPDLVIVCDKSKLDDRGCVGSPDIVIEILSPFTASKDMKEKFLLYEQHGVKEYWIVHPVELVIEVFKLLDTKKYGRPDIYSKEDKITTSILESLEIDLELVFAE